jgi:hypothetical protein
VRDESKKITEFRDVQLTVLVPIGHLELGLYEAQQLGLADFAIVVPARALVRVLSHGRYLQYPVKSFSYRSN